MSTNYQQARTDAVHHLRAAAAAAPGSRTYRREMEGYHRAAALYATRPKWHEQQQVVHRSLAAAVTTSRRELIAAIDAHIAAFGEPTWTYRWCIDSAPQSWLERELARIKASVSRVTPRSTPTTPPDPEPTMRLFVWFRNRTPARRPVRRWGHPAPQTTARRWGQEPEPARSPRSTFREAARAVWFA